MEDTMTNQDSWRDTSAATRGNDSVTQGMGKTASDAFSKVSGMAQDLAQQAAGSAKQAASDTASTVTKQVKELLDKQVESGAEIVGHFANSAKRAADDLEQNAPQLAGIVRSFADRVDGYAGDLREQSVDELWRTASDFTRRQPALVFGMAAVVGFFAFRMLKSVPASSMPSPSIQPSSAGGRSSRSQYHGT
jgi:ElaB/YqjD/DUF883 family membrane-anchored ribosome-binding protein